MITILFATHDWVHVEANGHYYEFSLHHNGLVEEIEWRAELEIIREATLEDLKKRYRLREIPEKRVWKGGIQDMGLVRFTHETGLISSKEERDWNETFKMFSDQILKEHEGLKKDTQQTIDFLNTHFPHHEDVMNSTKWLKNLEGTETADRFFDTLLLTLIARKYTKRKPSDFEVMGWAMYLTLKETT